MNTQASRHQRAALQSNSLTTDIATDLAAYLQIHADALAALIQHVPLQAQQLVDAMLACKGKIVFSGIGKSALVAQKLAATFSSLGLPAVFLHGSDALHGDLGLVVNSDMIVVLSKTAESKEFEYTLNWAKNKHIISCVISCMTGALSALCDMSIVLPFTQEACHLNLAPSSSTTLMSAFGDALAACVSKQKNVSRATFAEFHPAGALGRTLITTVNMLMHAASSLPFVQTDTLFTDLVYCMTHKKLGLAIVVDEHKRPLGIVTDGDLRRACSKGNDVFEKTAGDIMTMHPCNISSDELALRALEIMEHKKITSLLVVDQGIVVGLVHIHDIIQAGIRSI